MSLTLYGNVGDSISQYMAMYGINNEYRSSLDELAKGEIILALDDSGSMKGEGWRMLKETVEKIVNLALLFDSEIDVYFFNRGKVTIGCFEQLKPHLGEPNPHHGTPLLATFDRIVNDNRSILGERNIVVYTLTDGEPVGGYGAVSKWFQTHIAHDTRLQEKMAFGFQMCTHDQSVLKGYSKSVDGLKHLKIDVMGTYKDEKKQVEGKNRGYQYTENEHYVKQLLGPINNKFDQLDEGKVGVKRGAVQTDQVVVDWNEAHPNQGCCVVS